MRRPTVQRSFRLMFLAPALSLLLLGFPRTRAIHSSTWSKTKTTSLRRSSEGLSDAFARPEEEGSRAASTKNCAGLGVSTSLHCFPRGGASSKAGGSSVVVLASTSIGDKNDKTELQILEVLQLRPLWKWGMRFLALFTVLSLWEAYTTMGLPFAQAIWELLHAVDDDPSALATRMPDSYFPSAQDIRIARSLAAHGQAVLPNEDMPSPPETIAALLSLALYLVLQLAGSNTKIAYRALVPPGSPKSDMLEALQKATGNDLAVVVRTVQNPSTKDGKDGKQSTRIRPLQKCQPSSQDGPKKKTDDKGSKTKKIKSTASTPIYNFQLAAGQQLQWNPSNDKLTSLQ